jgi:hypothetical protein
MLMHLWCRDDWVMRKEMTGSSHRVGCVIRVAMELEAVACRVAMISIYHDQ